ncbi:hypothetical protein [Caenimonas aquaedulcis]|uniref:Uncharacterized protein n=1 Tax=Caenimonas aquaedulcis TaxID=2793270 RepID=A0A931MG79_9BURK|nr:hypothetical protein [Caenimonas aquaedulcis]MBG9387797.1 hypothetical protein [Caenimonas aquaedulcis]
MSDDAALDPQSFHRVPPAALVQAAAGWFDIDDDVALGCECADPALQIERWGQEMQAFPLQAS